MFSEIEIERIKDLYKSLGYEETTVSDNQVLVFMMRTGVYHGADILYSDEQQKERSNSVKKEYSDSGFATRAIEYTSYKELKKNLFDTVFHTTIQIERQKKKYKEFAEKQLDYIPTSDMSDPPQYVYQYPAYDFYSYGSEIEKSADDIISEILNLIDSYGPKLIIVEAAAGFGKTCTAYELLNRTITSKKEKFPFFTELSKNRRASIFRYVLLSEIDEAFDVGVKHDRILKYIKSGDIPLIIDGFDELISSHQSIRKERGDEDFKQVESMLSTISDLLTEEAKIILTSRKTAVFSSEEFFNWVNNNTSKFDIIRIIIKPPTINEWLPHNRIELIKTCGIKLQHLNNPVLLSMLKYCSDQTFFEIIQNNDSIISEYFNLLLRREIKRQELTLRTDEQLSIFRDLATSFLEFDTPHEDKDFVTQLIEDNCAALLEESRDRYNPENRPSIPELLEKLSNHVLLNKREDNESKIGFINDFVFGILLGDSIIEGRKELPERVMSSDWLNLIITAYSSRDVKSRQALWKRLLTKDGYSDLDLLLIDTSLLKCLKHDLLDLVVNQMRFESISFGSTIIEGCSFIGCTFKDCTFDVASFGSNNMFVSCVFDNCEVINENSISNSSCLACYLCDDYKSGFLRNISSNDVSSEIINNDESLEMLLLNSFVSKSGKFKVFLVHSVVSLFNSYSEKDVLNCISKLKRDRLIEINGNYIKITSEGRHLVYANSLKK